MTMAFMAGPYFHGAGTFISALDDEFDWSRAVLAGAFSLSRVGASIIGPLAGYLTDRLRPAMMVLIGFTIMAFGYVILSLVNSPTVFYLALLTIAIGAELGSFLPAVTSVTNWFTRRRSMAIALTMGGASVGGLFVGPLALGISHFGWSTVSIGIAVAVLLSTWFLSRTFKREPTGEEAQRQVEAVPVSSEPKRQWQSQAGGDFTAGQAFRTRTFWILAVAHAAVNLSLAAVIVHGVPHLRDIGMSLGVAGAVVTMYTAASLPAQLIGGWMGDYVNKRLLLWCFLVVQGIGVIVFAFATTLPQVYLFAILFGIGFGGRTPVLHALRADYFGRKAFASITGIYGIPLNIGMIVAPLALGLLFDIQHTYRYGMLALGISAVVGAFMILAATRPRLPSAHY